MPLVPMVLHRDPVEVLGCLANEPGAMLLEVPDPERPVTLLGCRPVAELHIEPGHPDALGAIAAFVADPGDLDRALPFPLGSVVACLAYELGAVCSPRAVPSAPDGPLAVLRRYDPMLVYDHRSREYSLAAGHAARARADWLGHLTRRAPAWHGPLGAAPLAAAWSADAWKAAVRRTLEYLAAGDAYQVNLTQPFTAPLAGPAWTLFARLAREHPAAFSAYLDLGDGKVVANSPELLVRVRGRRIETRPIKGTRPRGDDPGHDAALAAALQADPKEAAEHVMIVDLERNDLGRICRTGSVHVEAFARLETHPTLHHLVSVVAGELADGVGLAALLRALFPGGSVTGAPKLRAMEIIAELEPWPRGVYTGALGLLHPGGDAELGLPIRTGVVRDGVIRWHAGCGIVADSDPERELAEAWLKTAGLRLALGETLAAEHHECSSG